MNKLVYLYELDSVCNSKSEMKLALDSMYKTIFIDGDLLVLTFNQFADSMLIASIIANEKMREAFIELIYQERIVVSCYKSTEIVSSPVQYVIMCLKGFLTNNRNFVFSAADYLNITSTGTKKRLFEIIMKSLEYNDVDYLVQELNKQKIFKEEKKNIFIKNYVEFLLKISLCGIKKLPIKNDGVFLKNIIKLVNENFIIPDSVKSIFKEIDAMEKEGCKVNNRSFWYDYFKHDKNLKKDDAEEIIDLCYNIVTESSITGIKSIQDSDNEQEYIKKQYKALIKRYGDNTHRYYYNNTTAEKYNFSDKEINKWQSVVRIVSQIVKVKDRPTKWYWKRYYSIIDTVNTWYAKINLSFFITLCVQIFKFSGVLFVNDIFNLVGTCMDKKSISLVVVFLFSELVTQKLAIPNFFDILFNKNTCNDIKTYLSTFFNKYKICKIKISYEHLFK